MAQKRSHEIGEYAFGLQQIATVQIEHIFNETVQIRGSAPAAAPGELPRRTVGFDLARQTAVGIVR